MKDIARFLRFEYLAFALLLTQIGAASVASPVTGRQVVGLLLASFALHVYISLLNDLVDLPLDRTNPGRKSYPLVKGTIKPWQAWIVTLAMIPLLVGLTVWLGGGAVAFAAVAVTLGMMTIYDVWGKKTRVPPVIDLVQGVGFAAMVLLGADVVGEAGALTWLLFVWVVTWMVLANFLGGMRDLKEDHQFGVFTTPIMFGMKHEHDAQEFPRWTPFYGYSLQASMTVLAIVMLVQDASRYEPSVQVTLIAVVLLMGVAAIFLLVTLFGVARYDFRVMKKVGSLQLSVSLSTVLVPFIPSAHGWLFAALLAVLYSPSLKFRPAWIKNHWLGPRRVGSSSG